MTDMVPRNSYNGEGAVVVQTFRCQTAGGHDFCKESILDRERNRGLFQSRVFDCLPVLVIFQESRLELRDENDAVFPYRFVD